MEKLQFMYKTPYESEMENTVARENVKHQTRKSTLLGHVFFVNKFPMFLLIQLFPHGMHIVLLFGK